MNYKLKYIKYKKEYIKLKNKKIIYDLIGGACTQKKLNFTNIDSILEFIKEYYTCAPNQTKNQYFVILYGPPASGKTLSRKIACKLIKDNFDEKLSYDDIYNSFIDTGVDEIVSKTLINETENTKSVEEQMIDNINHILTDENKTLQFIKDNIDRKDIIDMKKKNSDLYIKYRKLVDEMSLVLGAFATFVRKNVFFEISSPYIDYIINLINTAYKWNYKIIFIYPYTNNIDLLNDRVIIRGLQVGRFIEQTEIIKKITECYTAYTNKIINFDNDKSMLNEYENIIIFRYNTKINSDEQKLLSTYNYNFDDPNINEKIYDYIIKNNKKINIYKITE